MSPFLTDGRRRYWSPQEAITQICATPPSTKSSMPVT